MEIEKLREYAKSRMSEKRYKHSLGVEKTAAKLAKKYGANEGNASIAGILHDITKELSYEEQLQCCKEFGIILDEVENNEPKILHPLTAAYFVKIKLKIENEDVFQAIRNHTTARKGMSTLEKIIYLADFIEPNRSFEGVEELRKLAAEDLDKAMIEATIMAICEVALKHRMIHNDTIEALNENLFLIRIRDKG